MMTRWIEADSNAAAALLAPAWSLLWMVHVFVHDLDPWCIQHSMLNSAFDIEVRIKSQHRIDATSFPLLQTERQRGKETMIIQAHRSRATCSDTQAQAAAHAEAAPQTRVIVRAFAQTRL